MAAITYLSLGWGVQSFTLAAMVALGELEGLDVAVHADTTHEAEGTYDFARRWTPWLGEHGVRVETVTPENHDLIVPNKKGARTSVYLPAFSLNPITGHKGQVKRQCTDNWKIRPLRAYVKTLLPGRPYPGAIDCWQGISLDEWERMRTADVKYIINKYPLVDRRMTRGDCINWLEAHGLEVPPKSACVFCPFHSLGAWKRLKQRGGIDWDYAVAADSAIRRERIEQGFELYVHPHLKPLAEAVKIPEDFGALQVEFEFERPCDGGVCFV